MGRSLRKAAAGGRHALRQAFLFSAMLLASVFPPGRIVAQPNQTPANPFIGNTITAILATGDGRTRETAFVVEGALWEYNVLNRLRLRFQRQKSMVEDGQTMDVISAREGAAGEVRDVWFRVAPDTSRPPQDKPGETRFNPDLDRIVRAMVTSGDGATPETAFVVGGRLGAEYQILRILGLRSERQALMAIRGCELDILSGRDSDTGDIRPVYFKLGRDTLEPGGPCVLGPADPNQQRP